MFCPQGAQNMLGESMTILKISVTWAIIEVWPKKKKINSDLKNQGQLPEEVIDLSGFWRLFPAQQACERASGW